jgi:hypothetical protein
MNDHARLVLLMWQSVSDFLPPASRDDAAEALIRTYMDTEDVELKEFFDLSGDCQHLDAALEVLEEALDNELEHNYVEDEDEHDY